MEGAELFCASPAKDDAELFTASGLGPSFPGIGLCFLFRFAGEGGLWQVFGLWAHC